MLTLPSDLTHRDAAAYLAQSLDQCLEQLAAAGSASSSELQVDASALQHFDSSALAVLLELRRQAQARGQSFKVTGMSVRLSELAGLYGVDGLMANPA